MTKHLFHIPQPCGQGTFTGGDYFLRVGMRMGVLSDREQEWILKFQKSMPGF